MTTSRDCVTEPMSIHSCSYYCDRPECIKAQRDELRDRLSGDKDGERYRSLVAEWRAERETAEKEHQNARGEWLDEWEAGNAAALSQCADHLDAAIKESGA